MIINTVVGHNYRSWYMSQHAHTDECVCKYVREYIGEKKL